MILLSLFRFSYVRSRYFSTILCLALKTFITGLTVSTFFLFFELFNSFFYILFIFFSFCPLPFDAIKSITLFSEGGPSDTIDLHIVHITVGKDSAFPWWWILRSKQIHSLVYLWNSNCFLPFFLKYPKKNMDNMNILLHKSIYLFSSEELTVERDI